MIDRKWLPIQDRSSSHKAGLKPLRCEASTDIMILSQHSERPMFSPKLMEVICERSNIERALKRVCQNKGAPGIDGMTVDDLKEHLKRTWPSLKESLLQGSYHPQPLRRIEIPKPSGKGSRKLSIPCALDRFIQQAILQVLQGPWDPTFSTSSFGFRPKRSAHQAIS